MTLPLGLAFDDVLLIPQESEVRPSQTVLATRLTKTIRLAIPILSAAMDTVSAPRLARKLSQLGGVSILHRNSTISEQVNMVRLSKREKGCQVGAAVGPYDLPRAKQLDAAGADVIVIDCAHAHKPSILASAKQMKRALKAQLVVGNIATAKAALAFARVADAMKVGVGPGSICTTRIIAGIGVPQLAAIMEVSRIAKRYHIPVIADGGIRYSGDIVKALAAGADCIMLGRLLAGTSEAAGPIVRINGKRYKRYRGMGSLGAMEECASADRYAQQGTKKYVPEGVEGLIPYVGGLEEALYQLLGGVRAGMGYVGAKTIGELQKRAQFIQITEAARRESHPHSVIIAKDAPNYALSTIR